MKDPKIVIFDAVLVYEAMVLRSKSGGLAQSGFSDDP